MPPSDSRQKNGGRQPRRQPGVDDEPADGEAQDGEEVVPRRRRRTGGRRRGSGPAGGDGGSRGADGREASAESRRGAIVRRRLMLAPRRGRPDRFRPSRFTRQAALPIPLGDLLRQEPGERLDRRVARRAGSRGSGSRATSPGRRPARSARPSRARAASAARPGRPRRPARRSGRRPARRSSPRISSAVGVMPHRPFHGRSSPCSYSIRQACRRTLPLDVFGMLPYSSSRRSWTCSSCRSATAWRTSPASRRDVQPAAAAVDLLHDDQPRPAVARHLEGGPAARPQPRVDGLHRRLDVLRVVVAAADDDHVLDPPGDEQLAVPRRSRGRRSAGTAPRPCRQSGVERPLRLLGAVPVPGGDRRAARPRSRRRGRPAARRAASGSTMRTSWSSHGRPQPTSVPRRLAGAGRDGPALFQRGRAHGQDHRRRGLRPAGHEQRRLGQSVARVERLRAEAARRERRREPLHRPRADRLRADRRDAPVAQVERRRARA